GLDAHAHLVRAGRVERDLLDRRRDTGLRVDETSHATRRSCSSSAMSGSWNASIASSELTTLSPRASIVNWARVTGAPGSRSVTAAWTRIAANGTWTDGRREPRTRFRWSQNSFHVGASGPPISNVRPAASGSSSDRE